MCLVIVQEKERGFSKRGSVELEASVILSSDKREYEVVSIIRVNSYEEGLSISKLYNQMSMKGIRVNNLYRIVKAVRTLKTKEK